MRALSIENWIKILKSYIITIYLEKRRYKMKKIIVSMVVLFLIIVLNGCATHANFVTKYNGWIGKNISELIGQSGYPNSSYDIPNGNKVYVYTKNTTLTSPSIGFGGYFGRNIGSNGYIGFPLGFGWNDYNEVVQSCTLFIETDKKGTIVKWGSKGNNCVANEPKSN